MSQAYAVYVEKELVGKYIKSSKVRVLWQIAFDEDLAVHQIELKHSIVSGKREILFDNQPVYANKALFQGTFEHRSKLAGHEVRVTVEDTFEGYLYDLSVDTLVFHRMPRKTSSELEAMRIERREPATVKTDFASFTGKSKSTLDGGEDTKKKESKPKKDEPNLLDMDWDAHILVPKPAAQQPQYNPFESYAQAPPPQQYAQALPPQSYAQAPPPQMAQYDPFGQPQSQPIQPPAGYDQYGRPIQYQAPPPQYNPQQYSQQPPPMHDPFATYQPPQQQRPQQPMYQAPPPQQQQPYDPFS
jgi:hypothetical protein